jgi:signal transduction histidine kinase/ActR/RegA family two-component response regulator
MTGGPGPASPRRELLHSGDGAAVEGAHVASRPAPPPPASDASRDELVLVLAPTGRDGPLCCNVLYDRAGLGTQACRDIDEVCAHIARGAGACIIAEEALDVVSARRLIDGLGGQLPWSDLPVIVLAGPEDAIPIVPGNASAGARGVPLAVLRQRGNVTVLDRPLRIVTLVTTVQAALRARRRQYEVRDLLAETRNAVRQRDQFLAMLGHELRNPLATITNAMGVLDVASPPPDEGLETEQREIIRRQTDHLARLVDDLLDVSRITSGKIVLQRKPTDLCELARRAVKAVDGAARKQQHDVDVLTGCESVFVDSDPVRMEQVVNNLLTNAIKYTPAGGSIRVEVDSDNGQALLRVRDNGMGIPPELMSRVFDLFTQAERSLDRAQGGLGIGLTLVRALVEMHDGQVSVASEGPGRGSEFTITLPRTAAPQPAATMARPRKSNGGNGQGVRGDGKGRKILVIEDQADARRALQRLLQLWGHQVDVAEDGVRGVEAAMRNPPELALIDVGLPGLDGYEVARRLRKAMGRSVRLVALTGYGQPEDRERAFDAGFDMHLVKPVDRDQLGDAIVGVPPPQQQPTIVPGDGATASSDGDRRFHGP